MNIDGQMMYASKSGTMQYSGHFLDQCNESERAMFRCAEQRVGYYLTTEERVPKARMTSEVLPMMQAIYLDGPAFYRKKVVGVGNNEQERKLHENRRYLIGKGVCFDLEHTSTNIPIEFLEADLDSMMIEFLHGENFQYNGYEFNHVFFRCLEGKYFLSAYTEEGFGPIQFGFRVRDMAEGGGCSLS